MVWVYQVFWWLLLPVALLRLLWRSKNLRGYRHHILERLGFVLAPDDRIDLWWHAVSVGEMVASKPVIVSLLQQYPHCRIWVTTTTPTGRDQLQKSLNEDLGGRVFFSYAPYDHLLCVRAFLKRVQPNVLVMMETELWPNWILEAKCRQIPSLLVNARLSEQSLHGYLRFAGISRLLLSKLTLICAQAQADRERFLRLGANDKQVSVTGNVKFDISVTQALKQRSKTLRQGWGKRRVWLAASTHASEEALILKAHQALLMNDETLLLILVPRHPDRFNEVYDLVTSMQLRCIKRSSCSVPDQHTQVYLADTMGELLLLYGACDLVFMGGSLVPVGGHNMLEPVACYVPVVIGPHVFNFQRIFDLLDQVEGIIQISGFESLIKTLNQLLNDSVRCQLMTESAMRVLQDNQGACQKVCEAIGRFVEFED